MSEITENYRITVPSRKILEARTALSRLGIEMVPHCPQQELMATRETDYGNSYATASQIPGMLTQVNQHLQENGLSPRIDPDHDSWDSKEATEFLEMCLNEFEWEEGKISQAEFQDQEEWEDVQSMWTCLPTEDRK